MLTVIPQSVITADSQCVVVPQGLKVSSSTLDGWRSLHSTSLHFTSLHFTCGFFFYITAVKLLMLKLSSFTSPVIGRRPRDVQSAAARESVCEWTNSPVGEVPGDRQPPIRRQRSTAVVFFLSTGCEVDQPAVHNQRVSGWCQCECSDEPAGDGCFDWWIKVSIKKPNIPHAPFCKRESHSATAIQLEWGARGVKGQGIAVIEVFFVADGSCRCLTR